MLADLPAEIVTEVLVVDSNSTDGTPEIAAKIGARVLRESRRGYGRACLTGIANVQNPESSYFWTAITAIAPLNFRCCSLRSLKAARTSH